MRQKAQNPRKSTPDKTIRRIMERERPSFFSDGLFYIEKSIEGLGYNGCSLQFLVKNMLVK